MKTITTIFIFALAVYGAGAAQSPSAPEIVSKCVKAHGGKALSSWRTMKIAGTIEMEDGIAYKAAYRISAKMPDKLKVEQDMTADRGGRYVYEYFRNGDAVWSRRNLIVGKAELARLDRWMNECLGIAYYATNATSLTLKGEATSDWMTKSGKRYEVSERRPAYVITALTPAGAVDLFIDKSNFNLLQEDYTDLRRIYSGFKRFGATIHATQILEVTKGRTGEVVTPITYNSIRYDVRIEDWIFEEDMPRR